MNLSVLQMKPFHVLYQLVPSIPAAPSMNYHLISRVKLHIMGCMEKFYSDLLLASLRRGQSNSGQRRLSYHSSHFSGPRWLTHVPTLPSVLLHLLPDIRITCGTLNFILLYFSFLWCPSLNDNCWAIILFCLQGKISTFNVRPKKGSCQSN